MKDFLQICPCILTALVLLLNAKNAAADDRNDATEDKASPQGLVKSLNGLSGRVTLSAGPGVRIDPAGNGLSISVQPSDSPAAWKLTGNAGTTAGTSFLGTTDSQPLEFKVNQQRALRLEYAEVTTPVVAAGINVIGGYSSNGVAEGVLGATIAGGGAGFLGPNRVDAWFGAIGGGAGNVAAGYASFVGGGEFNVAGAAGTGFATVAGGNVNKAEGNFATVGGGAFNTAFFYGTVGGGLDNTASGYEATIGGGGNNSATNRFATVAGGERNTAGGVGSFVGGGSENEAAGASATVAGGLNNTASGLFAAIGGGRNNRATNFTATVAGGEQNYAWGESSSVGGGFGNLATGDWATVPGGILNRATNDAFAAGSSAQAIHSGAFVWADSHYPSIVPFRSVNPNEFAVRATGGVRLVSAVQFPGGAPAAGVALAPGSGTWTSLSDRNAKENFVAVDTQALLEKVAALPLTTWNYKSQAASIRHIGPTAQDFKSAFAVGETDTGITGVDADGVALAAIQGLNQKLEEQRAELKLKHAEIAELKQSVAELKELVAKLAGEQARKSLQE